jgi:hypothetical protein
MRVMGSRTGVQTARRLTDALRKGRLAGRACKSFQRDDKCTTFGARVASGRGICKGMGAGERVDNKSGKADGWHGRRRKKARRAQRQKEREGKLQCL